MLFEAGADVGYESGRQPQAIPQAIYAGDEVMTKLLLDAGADNEVEANCVYYPMLTPLRLASRDGHVEIVKSLLEAGAAIDNDPLMYDLNDGEGAPEDTPTVMRLTLLREHYPTFFSWPVACNTHNILHLLVGSQTCYASRATRCRYF